MPVLPVLVPIVKKILQKFPVTVRGEGITETAFVFFKRINAGYVLLISEALFPEILVNPFNPLGRLRGNNGENIEFHLIFLEKAGGFHDPGKAPAVIRKFPVFIMQLLVPIQR